MHDSFKTYFWSFLTWYITSLYPYDFLYTMKYKIQIPHTHKLKT